ncbi:7907_t:CDS:2 [Funneliformis geosporum]|uniref:12511_t:CDS:1 n=1 Tax=Funneliformis geosporum TaxID=1117311 RepID=A0A9W4SE41_9GLOM|nr:12511_t:CDS:2 [Funneliformis geosporum]CAI2169991.1 7907_t:CDS:2 [Funneliformis geosporum]
MSTDLLKIISKEYNDLLDTGEFSDVEILVGEEPNTKMLNLHSCILKLRSKYFRTLLTGSNRISKTKNNVIKLQKPGISVKIYEIIIKYIYCGVIDLASKNTRTNVMILIAANELGLTELCDHVEDYLLQDIKSLKQNFVLIQDVAYNFNHFKKLTKFYESTFQQDPSLIFRADDFTTIKHEILLDLLTKDKHSLKTIEIWDKLIEWSVVQSNGLLPSDATTWTVDNISTFGDLIQPFISHINFKVMNPSDFLRKIKPFKKIFDKDFYIEILEYYSFKTCSHSQQSKQSFALTKLTKFCQLCKKISSTDFFMYNYELLVLEVEMDR